jgi:branched-chain amino acid transport system substrate-binding protein
VVGEYHSSAALAAIPVYTQHDTPFVVVDAYADTITGGDPKDPKLPARPSSVFRIAPTTSYDVQLTADWLVEGRKVHDVVQVYEATDFGKGQAESMKTLLAAKGVKLSQVQIELNQPDYKSILGRVKQEHPDADAVVFSVTGETSYAVEANAFAVGLLGVGKLCVANQAAQDDKAFWRAVPDGAGCVFRVAGLMPSQYSQAASSLAERYGQKFSGATPKAWVFESYDAVRLLVDAINRAGRADSAAIVKALEQTSYQGVQGRYEFPYGSANAVPADQPGWLWHQWPKPAIQLAEYTAKNQALKDASVVWPPDRQSKPGTAFITPAAG